MATARRSLPFWLAGTAAALGGGVLVRFVAPASAAPVPLTLAGLALAVGGLFTITVGTRRKYAASRPPGGPGGS